LTELQERESHSLSLTSIWITYMYIIFFVQLLKLSFFFSYRFYKSYTYLYPFDFLFIWLFYIYFFIRLFVYEDSLLLQQTIRVQFSSFYFYVCETKMKYNKQNVYGNVYKNFQTSDCVVNIIILWIEGVQWKYQSTLNLVQDFRWPKLVQW